MTKEKGSRSRARILLIGDNPSTPLLPALQHEGYEAVCCDSPQNASALAQAFRPDVIIVHLGHPSRNDIVNLQQCRLMSQRIPIVVAASAPGHETLMTALEEGATSFLSLPLEGAKIKKVLGDLLAIHRQT